MFLRVRSSQVTTLQCGTRQEPVIVPTLYQLEPRMRVTRAVTSETLMAPLPSMSAREGVRNCIKSENATMMCMKPHIMVGIYGVRGECSFMREHYLPGIYWRT